MDYTFLPQGAEVGESGVHYLVWAPKAKAVAVEIQAGGGNSRSLALHRCSQDFFHGLDSRGKAGDCYMFYLDSAVRVPDPASRWQPQGVHGPSMVIDPRQHQWCDTRWKRPTYRDLVIYELHVGTFTPDGTFRSAIEKLSYIRDLGVTAVELMPICDFAGGRNWGYDGVCLYAPSRAYGHPDDLRAFVEAAHANGLAVILDVVYNHFGPAGNYLHEFLGPFLDESKKTPWGGAIPYGDPRFKPLRNLVTSNPIYWMREFHIDGFRCDATHAIFDDSSRHILKEITAGVHERSGYVIAEDARNDLRLIMPEEQGGFGFDGVWADDFHHVVRVANTQEDEGYFADFEGSTSELVDTLQNGWLYRGQYSKSQSTRRGTECIEGPPERFVHCISNHDQTGNHAFGERLAHRIHPKPLLAAETLLCLSPYTPMLFMGQEWAASTPFLFFTEHDEELGELIRKGRREEFRHFAVFQDPTVLDKIPDPQKVSTFEASKLVWDERERRPHAETIELYRACLGLRFSSQAFRPTDRRNWESVELNSGLGMLCFHGPDAEWRVVFDLKGGHAGSLKDEAAFDANASWEVVLSSNETRFGGTGACAINVVSMTARFTVPETVVLRTALR